MTAHTSILHIPVDEETKAQANAALENLGLSMSDAIGLLLRRIAVDQAFPFELKDPNAETRAAMDEADAIARTRSERFSTADALFGTLEKAAGR